ncbi:MAG: IMP dehydrogenase [Candidatus Deianiraeaceae bacterium]
MVKDIFSSGEYLTFADVLLLPSYSEVLPLDVSTSTSISTSIPLEIPLLSSAMDTVTEHKMAIKMSQNGGIGCIHKNLSVEEQVAEVTKVKRYESGVISDPILINADASINDAISLMESNGISGLPVIDHNHILVGIVTNRDTRFLLNKSALVQDVMTKNIITVAPDFNMSEVKKLFHQHKIEKLIIKKGGKCVGMLTVKDIEKSKKYPFATKDINGRLAVAAAVGVGEKEFERVHNLIDAHCDVIVIDTAHGHSKGVIDMVKKIRKFSNITIVAGNIATPEAVETLAKAGANAVKVGIGPGSICTTRIVAGVGVPQLSAVYNCAKMAKKYGLKIIADGGIRTSGDIAKAIAAGADCVMIGSLLAGTDESPGQIVVYDDVTYKEYRGMGSIGAMERGSSERYFQGGVQKNKLVPEGIEGVVPYKGHVEDVLHQLIGGLRSAMGYVGQPDITSMQKNSQFIKITNAGLKESHPHNIKITKDAPNYG